MRLFIRAVLCLLSTVALAAPPKDSPKLKIFTGPPTPEMVKDMRENPWDVEFITQDGKYSRIAGYPSKETCEAAIPQVLREQSGFNGHCVYMEWGTGRIIGSQDPGWSLSDQWVVEFNAVDGKYNRIGVGFPSKEACEAAIPFQLRMHTQGGYNGRCIELKEGNYMGSHDPVWAGK